jgi:3-oxoadipate enol-lactonase
MAERVDIAGARIAYDVSGEGDAMVLSHAGLGDMRTWDPQVDAFGQRFRVVRYDGRGFGQTEETGAGDVPFRRSDDLLALLHHLGIERAHLVGGSLGGRVSLDAALSAPERVLSLIVVGSALGGYRWTDPQTHEGWEESETAVLAGELEKAAEIEMQMWLAGRGRSLGDVDPAVRDLVRRMLLDSYAHGEVDGETGLEPPAIGRLDEIRMPALVIVGDEDSPDVLRIADVLASGIAGARKVVMRGTAHAPNMEQPAEFNRVVLEFLSSI